jgi:excisionase family DNA binding protein
MQSNTLEFSVRHLTPRELAERLRCSIRTIERWRRCGKGPAYLKAGGRVLYRLVDVETWERENRSMIGGGRVAIA